MMIKIKNKHRKNISIKWKKEPEDHDYPAAYSYLCLHFPESIAASIVEKLRKAKMSIFKAKDIFRASNKSLLGISNSHVEENIKKILKGKKLSPLLLVRYGDAMMLIADGYHRICGAYHFNEDEDVPVKIVDVEC